MTVLDRKTSPVTPTEARIPSRKHGSTSNTASNATRGVLETTPAGPDARQRRCLRRWFLTCDTVTGRGGWFRPIHLIAVFALSATTWLPSAVAAGFIDPAAIDREVAVFIGVATGGLGSAPPVDRRLRLAPCATPLGLSWRGDRHDTVLVQCPDAGGWHLFVPVHNPGASSSGMAAVARGEEVTVAITGDGFTVSQSGEALEGGVVGDWIRVKDAKTSEPIRAQIVRPGLVAVLLP